jgi:glycosyltransferase involved in cell wall biosynthesis
MSSCWHIITPEYPPNKGGISAYTMQVALGLRSEGDEVHVWCPLRDLDPAPAAPWVHGLEPWLTGNAIRSLDRQLDAIPGPRRLLVQWLPHGYGYRTMNLPFCLWLWRRARRGDRVEIMLHEAFLRFREGSWKQDVAAAVHRIMTIVLIQAASRVWMSTPAWEPMWQPYCLGRRIPFVWLPIPSNIPVSKRPEQIVRLKTKYAPAGEMILGHFGTFGSLITRILDRLLPLLLEGWRDRVFLLVGRGGEDFRRALVARRPELASRIHASGTLEPEELSAHLGVCDLLVQPYPDGITTRRTSLMAGMAHGVATLTTSGELTETLWAESGAVALAPVGDWERFAAEAERLLLNAQERSRIGSRALELYAERFDASRIISTLRDGAPAISFALSKA